MGQAQLEVVLARIYDSTPPSGYRVLADRLWPRGVTKAAADIDLWAKEIAPSNELRRWAHADPGRFEEFRDLYAAELANPEMHPRLVALIEAGTSCGRLVLVTANRDPVRSHLTVLEEFLFMVSANTE